ncbi:MAG: hypothetical protein AAF915_24775 [Cyanobacteria bacterium P01_D01_bin.50]
MKKQRLPLNLGLVALFTTSLIGAISVRVNAGSSPIPGVAPDSSGVTGGIFNPEPPAAPATPAAGTGATVDAGGQVSVSPAVQTRVNISARAVVSRGIGAGASPASRVVIRIAAGGRSAGGAISRVSASIRAVGVSPAAIGGLLNSFASLLAAFGVSDANGVPVASIQPVAIGTTLAQNGATPDVDINKLNASINAYNQIIMESDDETLKKLSQNAEFVEIGNVLRELRASLVQG